MDLEFLRNIFGDKALTFAELETALKDNKDVKIANLATGGYVDRGKFDALDAKNKTLSEQLAKLGDAKPDELQAEIARLKSENEQAEQRYRQTLLDHAVESRLMSEGAVDVKAVRALLDMNKVRQDGEALFGLDEQITALKKDKPWAFPEKESKSPEINGAVPAGSGNQDNQQDVALINGLLGL